MKFIKTTLLCTIFALLFMGTTYAQKMPTVEVEVDHVLCNGQKNGNIHLLDCIKCDEIEWGDGLAKNQKSRFDLPAGTYTVTITNKRALGDKSITKTITIREPDVLIAIAYQSSEDEATVDVVGGTPPYKVLWKADYSESTANTTTVESSPGLLTVLVTDAHGCTAESSIRVVPLTVPVANNDTVYVDLEQCGKIAPLDLLANDFIDGGKLVMDDKMNVGEEGKFLFKIPCYATTGEQITIDYVLKRDSTIAKATLTVVSVVGGIDGGKHFVLNPTEAPFIINPEVVDQRDTTIACHDDACNRDMESHTELKYYNNDVYSHGEESFLEVLDKPTIGQVINEKNKIYYIAPNYPVVDTIMYRVCTEDKSVCDTAIVVVTVAGGGHDVADNNGSPCSILNNDKPIPVGYSSWCAYWSDHHPNLISWTDSKKINCQDICGNFHHDDGEGDGKKGKQKIKMTEESEEY